MAARFAQWNLDVQDVALGYRLERGEDNVVHLLPLVLASPQGNEYCLLHRQR